VRSSSRYESSSGICLGVASPRRRRPPAAVNSRSPPRPAYPFLRPRRPLQHQCCTCSHLPAAHGKLAHVSSVCRSHPRLPRHQRGDTRHPVRMFVIPLPGAGAALLLTRILTQPTLAAASARIYTEHHPHLQPVDAAPAVAQFEFSVTTDASQSSCVVWSVSRIVGAAASVSHPCYSGVSGHNPKKHSGEAPNWTSTIDRPRPESPRHAPYYHARHRLTLTFAASQAHCHIVCPAAISRRSDTAKSELVYVGTDTAKCFFSRKAPSTHAQRTELRFCSQGPDA